MLFNSLDDIDIADILRLFWCYVIEIVSMLSTTQKVIVAGGFLIWILFLLQTICLLIGWGLRLAGYDPDERLFHFIDLFMISLLRLAKRFVGMDPDKRKANALLKTDQTRSDRSATVSCLPNANHNDPDVTNFLKVHDGKRRLEIEIEILEEVLRARREELARFG